MFDTYVVPHSNKTSNSLVNDIVSFDTRVILQFNKTTHFTLDRKVMFDTHVISQSNKTSNHTYSVLTEHIYKGLVSALRESL